MASDLINNAIFFFTDIYSKLIIKIVVALIIILLGFIVGKIVGRLIYKLLSEIKLNVFFHKATGLKVKPDLIISNSVTYLIDFFVLIIAFDAVAFTPTLVYIISGALLAIIIISIIIGIKDIIPNAIAGLIIYQKNMISKGDNIIINNHAGKIERITLLETIIKKKNRDLLYIPNSAVLKYDIVKKS